MSTIKRIGMLVLVVLLAGLLTGLTTTPVAAGAGGNDSQGHSLEVSPNGRWVAFTKGDGYVIVASRRTTKSPTWQVKGYAPSIQCLGNTIALIKGASEQNRWDGRGPVEYSV